MTIFAKTDDRVTRADELVAELNGTADKGRRISDAELEEWMNRKECAAFLRAEQALDI
jgi:hypothetical protein